MELAKGGELFDKLLEQGCLSEYEAANIMSQVGFKRSYFEHFHKNRLVKTGFSVFWI